MLEGGVPVAVGGRVHQLCENGQVRASFFLLGIKPVPHTVCSVPAFWVRLVVIGGRVRIPEPAHAVSVVTRILQPNGQVVFVMVF